LTFLEAALAYARRGVRVFPLSPGSKMPLIAKRHGGRGLHDATTDEVQIKAWWSQYPEANIGVATGEGSGLVVLDLDVKPDRGRPGVDSLRELEAKHGELPPTLTARTPRGGFHLYYRAVPGLGSSASVLGVNVDTRADGGYVVAPPSVFDGKRYEFVHEVEPAALPEWLAATWPRAGVRAAKKVAPIPPYDGPVQLQDLQLMLSELRVAKSRSDKPVEVERHALLCRVLEGKPLAPLGGRTRALLSVTGMMARKFPAGLPADAACELLRTSLSKMPMDPTDPAHEQAVDFWLKKAMTKYQSAMQARVNADAEAAAAREFRDQMRAQFLSANGIEVEQLPAGAVEAEDWREGLTRHPKTNEVLDRPMNVRQILAMDDRLCGFVKWNELRRRVDVVGGPFAAAPVSVLVTEIRTFLLDAQPYSVKVKSSEVGEQLLAVARKHPYNPVCDYLRSLEWDGVPRLGHGDAESSWLERYCVAVMDVGGKEIVEHVRRVAWKTMVAAVARAFEPGCQVDTMTILEGEQGIRKSTAFRILGGEWHRTASLDVHDKDTKMQVGTAWIDEFGELDGITRVEAARLKNFITTPQDSYRVPYGKDTEDWPRRCLFVGTTNDAEYLRDPTGLRRFWPISVRQVDSLALEQDRDQLWAEAVRVYDQHVAWKEAHPGMSPDDSPHRWWLVGEENEPAEMAAESRSVHDSLVGKVLAWWQAIPPQGRPVQVGAYEVAEQALELGADKINQAMLTRVGVAMRKLGFVKRKVTVQRSREWVYEANDILRAMPQDSRARLGGYAPQQRKD